MPTPAVASLASREWRPGDPAAAGQAPVIVLVHGIVGWSRTWWRVAPVLVERGWRVIAVDQRGHGASPRIEGVATVRDLAADLAATIDALGPRSVDGIIGHSLGAAATMELAYERPEIARRIVLEDPPGQTRADDVEFQATLEREVWAARTRFADEVRREMAENPTWHPEDARQNVEGRAICDIDGILASLRADTGVRAPELAPLLRGPALYLVADDEHSALGEHREPLLRSLPAQAMAVEFACGHTIHRDRFDDYVATVLRWLEGR
jgi:pimeloyl-ACP methyl ester carboxylesterase